VQIFVVVNLVVIPLVNIHETSLIFNSKTCIKGNAEEIRNELFLMNYTKFYDPLLSNINLLV